MSNLERTLGFWPLLAFGVAGVLGASWIYTNSKFFALYGAGGVLVGLAIGVTLATFIAIAYSRLTAMFPRAGGELVFSYATIGRRTSFLTGWLLLGAYVSSLAFYVTAFGYLLGKFVPAINSMPLYSINGETVGLPVLVLGVALTLMLFALNWFGTEVGGSIQLGLFIAILVGGLVLAVVGFASGQPSNFLPLFAEGSHPVADSLRFVVPGMTFVAGFGLVAVLAEDSTLSPRSAGRLVILTVVCAGVFYLLVLSATAWVRPWREVATMKLGTIDAFRAAGYPALGLVAYLIAVAGLLTSFLGLFVASSRILVAMGRAGLLPRSLSRLHPAHGTPHVALALVTLMTLALGWMGPGAVTWFLDTGGVDLGLVWVLVTIAFARAPRKFPDLVPDRQPVRDFLPFVGAVGALLVIVLALWPGTDYSLVWPAEYVILAAWLVLGAVLYLLAPKVDDKEALAELLGSSYADTVAQEDQP